MNKGGPVTLGHKILSSWVYRIYVIWYTSVHQRQWRDSKKKTGVHWSNYLYLFITSIPCYLHLFLATHTTHHLLGNLLLALWWYVLYLGIRIRKNKCIGLDRWVYSRVRYNCDKSRAVKVTVSSNPSTLHAAIVILTRATLQFMIGEALSM